MMTPAQWKALGEWVRRRHVLAVGIGTETLDAVTQEIKSPDEVNGNWPARTIAAMRLQRTDGRRSRLLFFKRTVSVLLPREYR
jgi:hypothetical protein